MDIVMGARKWQGDVPYLVEAVLLSHSWNHLVCLFVFLFVCLLFVFEGGGCGRATAMAPQWCRMWQRGSTGKIRFLGRTSEGQTSHNICCLPRIRWTKLESVITPCCCDAFLKVCQARPVA